MTDSKWRIILHWTAGADGVNEVEADAYHFIVARDGTVHSGKHKPEDNIPPLRPGGYAAHTLNCNSDAISVSMDAMAGVVESMDAMAGAVERPFNAGRYPITEVQVEAACKLVAQLCKRYSIPVDRTRVLSHAEVQPTLGIPQRNKWDIAWLPGMDRPGDPVMVGNRLREKVSAYLRDL